MVPAKAVSLIDQSEQPAALVRQEQPEELSMIERLARDPAIDVAKLERLIAMQERVLDRQREAAFNEAFVAMQPDIPEITEKGEIKNKEGHVQSKYALNEDIQRVLRPILKQSGFSLSFSTEWPDKKTIKVVGILTHVEGHSRKSEFLSDADTSGNKNSVQALGSAISYGRRYTTLDLLNITSRGQDDDGQGVSKLTVPEPPKGYDDWKTDMSATADNGIKALSKAFNESKKEFRDYATKHDRTSWEGLKTKATQVQA